MPDHVGTSQVIRFATFEVDLQAQELRKGGFAGEFVRNSAQMEWSAAGGITRLFRIPLRLPPVHLPKSATNGTDRSSRRQTSLSHQSRI